MQFTAHTPTITDGNVLASITWIATGSSLLAYAVALAWLSHRTASSLMDVELAATWLVAFSVPVGLVYLFGLWPITRKRSTKMMFVSIIVVGFAMRAIILTSPPSLEYDFLRYLWDGAVTAHGLDPYRYSPTQVLWASVGAETVPPEFLQLATEAGPVFEKINNPRLTTIYPPIAQLAFATAHWIAPWSTYSWRVVLLLADGVTLVILLRLLSFLGLSSAAIAWYWWNPILLRETYGGAHMDVLTLPFVMGAVLLATRKRFNWSMFFLALAGGVKLWPILLAPVLLRPLFASPSRLISPVVMLLATTLIVWMPTMPSAFGPDSGFLAYAAGWQNNAGAFPLVESILGRALAFVGNSKVHLAGPMTRGLMGALLAAWIAWQTRRGIADGRDVLRRCLMIVASLFLISPTQFPWYYAWLVPFLAIMPSTALLAYAALLPLYYVHARHPAIAWLEHGPVWFLLIRGLVAGYRATPDHRVICSTAYPEPTN